MITQPSQPQSAQSRDAADIGALYQQLLQGWNQRDAAAYAALFAEDASVIGFDGSQMNGRADIVGEVVEIIAVIPKSEAAIWLAREGILPEPDIPASGED